MVIVRDSDLNKVDLRAAGDGTEIQDEDRPVVFFPVRGAPELYDEFAWGDEEILSSDLSAACAEPASRFAANASGMPVDKECLRESTYISNRTRGKARKRTLC